MDDDSKRHHALTTAGLCGGNGVSTDVLNIARDRSGAGWLVALTLLIALIAVPLLLNAFT